MNTLLFQHPEFPLRSGDLATLESRTGNLLVAETMEKFLDRALVLRPELFILGPAPLNQLRVLLRQLNDLFPLNRVILLQDKDSPALSYDLPLDPRVHSLRELSPEVLQTILDKKAEPEGEQLDHADLNEGFLESFQTIFRDQFAGDSWTLMARTLCRKLSARMPLAGSSVLAVSDDEVWQAIDGFAPACRKRFQEVAVEAQVCLSEIAGVKISSSLQVRYFGRFAEEPVSGASKLKSVHLPFFREGKMVGLISLIWQPDKKLPGFSSGVLSRNFALFNTIVGEAETMRLKAILDPLTTALRHDTTVDMVEEVRRNATRQGFPFVVAAIDIDFFKELNDTHGHAVGDLILKGFVSRIKNTLRASDYVGRIGGDEFILIIPGMGARECRRFAPFLLHSIRSQPIPAGSKSFPIQISAGIAALDPFTAERVTTKQILEITDGALYRAKQSGRDQAFIYAEDEFNPMIEEDASGNSQLLPPEANLRSLPEIENLIRLFQSMLRLKGDLFGYHCFRTERVAIRLGEALGFRGKELWTLKTGALLHDIGKLGLPETVLRKDANLTEEERDIIETHPEIGAQMLEPYSSMRAVAEIVRSHHERFDGLGYPRQIEGSNIFFPARIVAVAEVFDALVSNRPYREGMRFEEALKVFRSESGTAFDPEVVTALEAVLPTLIQDYADLKKEYGLNISRTL